MRCLLGILANLVAVSAYALIEPALLYNPKSTIQSFEAQEWDLNISGIELPTGIDPKAFFKLVQDQGVPIHITEKPILRNANDVYPKSKSILDVCGNQAKSHLIYSGTFWNVYRPEKSYKPGHIVIVSKHCDKFENLKDEELVELDHFKSVVLKMLEKTDEMIGQVTFYDSQKTYCQNHAHVGIEIIPSRYLSGTSKKAVDYKDKIFRASYMFFNAEVTSEKALLKPIKTYREVFYNIRQYPLLCFPHWHTTMPWNVSVKNKEWFKLFSHALLFETWKKEGLLTAKCSSNTPLSHTGITTLTNLMASEKSDNGEFSAPTLVTQCVFCRQDVLKKQNLFLFDHSKLCAYHHPVSKMRVLTNARPLNNKHQILIIPCAHIERWVDLTSGEQFWMNKITQRLLRLMRQVDPQKGCLFFEQVSVEAGQTEPHFHRHVLVRPNLSQLAAILFQQSSDKLPREHLTPDQYQELMHCYGLPLANDPTFSCSIIG